MKVNGQLYILAALPPRKESPVPIVQEAGWATEPDCPRWRRYYLSCPESNHGHTARSLVTEIHRLPGVQEQGRGEERESVSLKKELEHVPEHHWGNRRADNQLNYDFNHRTNKGFISFIKCYQLNIQRLVLQVRSVFRNSRAPNTDRTSANPVLIRMRQNIWKERLYYRVSEIGN